MAQVITFTAYRPSPRADGLPWTEAHIEEGPTEDGPWTEIDVIALSPLDTNPAAPMLRSFTTELASETPDLWYRVVFYDATGDLSQPTAAVQNCTTQDAGGTGPCSQWVTAEEVADCCGIEFGSDTEEALELAAEQASDILFALSGRLYRGVCGPVTVRPCRNRSTCYVPGRDDPVRACGCAPLSEVHLAGYPVVEIAEVKIDGEVQDPSEYRLDGHRKLVRLADADGGQQWWPSCQRLDLADTEERTFSVTYYYGTEPPSLAGAAAAQLACEIYRACTPGAGECQLPSNASRVTRQGITIERDTLTTFLQSRQTGLVKVDAFLAAYAMNGGASRRPAVWSPDGPRFAQRVGS